MLYRNVFRISSAREKFRRGHRPLWFGFEQAAKCSARAGCVIPREMWQILGLTVFGAVLIGAELLIGRELVNLIVDATDVVAGDLVPWLIMLGVALMLTSLVNAATAELRTLLSN